MTKAKILWFGAILGLKKLERNFLSFIPNGEEEPKKKKKKEISCHGNWALVSFKASTPESLQQHI